MAGAITPENKNHANIERNQIEGTEARARRGKSQIHGQSHRQGGGGQVNKYYYHAGSQKTVDGEVRVYWSAKTRRSKAQAESEAVRIAREQGGKPVVEFWSREHGLRPGWDCAEGAYDVTAIEVPD